MKMIGAMFNGKPVIGFKNGTSEPVEYHSWRTPETGDRLGGATLRFIYPSSNPIQITGYDMTGYNNNYLITSNDNYFVQELGSYETVSTDETNYTWSREKFTASLTITNTSTGYSEKIYECDTIVYNNHDTGAQTVESVTENIRKTEVILPNDIGDLYLCGGTMFGIYPQVDEYRITQRGYEYASLTGSENLQNGLILQSFFPANADTLLVPSLPAPNEYGSIQLGDEFTLFAAETSYVLPGNDWDTMYVYSVMAMMFEDYDYETEVANGYFFYVSGQEMMQGQTVYAKKWNSSEAPSPANGIMVVPKCGVSYTLSQAGLNTSSPLYPYIKKIQWTED